MGCVASCAAHSGLHSSQDTFLSSKARFVLLAARPAVPSCLQALSAQLRLELPVACAPPLGALQLASGSCLLSVGALPFSRGVPADTKLLLHTTQTVGE